MTQILNKYIFGNAESPRIIKSADVLHAKTFEVDGRQLFVGSFNMDPRSASLNTEMGLLFHDRDAAAALQAVYRAKTDAGQAYRLRLQRGELRWEDAAAQPPQSWAHEPESRAWQRAAVWLLSWLPIESQL